MKSRKKGRSCSFVEPLEGRVLFAAGDISGTVYSTTASANVSLLMLNPIPGVTVFSDASGNSALDDGEVSTLTGDDGRYSIASDPAALRIVTPDGYRFDRSWQ